MAKSRNVCDSPRTHVKPPRRTGGGKERELDLKRAQLGTRQVAKLMGIPPGRLTRAVWDGRIPPPEKLPGGSYGWQEADIARACRCLLGRSWADVATGQKEV